jgi:C_GCAxxG_C_C family probable redox protein
MVIGMRYGRTELDDLAAKEKTYEVAQEFIREFRRRHHSVNCTELLGYDLSNPRQLADAREKKVFHAKCPEFVRDAGDILEEIL